MVYAMLMESETIRYLYKLRPGKTAERGLEAEWHRCRYLWNEAVHQQRSGRKPTFCKLSKLLTEGRKRIPWLAEGSSVAQQQMLRTFALALQHAFKVKGRRFPKYKQRKTALPSLEYTTNGFKLKDGRLRLPGKLSIPVVWSRELPSEPKSCRVYQDNLGDWYVSFVVKRERTPLPPTDRKIGIDWGVKVPATTTDPDFDLLYLGHRKNAANEVAKAQRKMARRKPSKGKPASKGYKRAKRESAKALKHARRQNQHDGRMWVQKIVGAFDLIACEDFKPKFLAKSTMARKAADSSVGTLQKMLLEYASRAERKVVMVQPAYTTMTCSKCFARAKQRFELDERIFRCWDCGHEADRDRNAAWTIQAVAGHNCTSVEGVRLPEVEKLPELGIPRL